MEITYYCFIARFMGNNYLFNTWIRMYFVICLYFVCNLPVFSN